MESTAQIYVVLDDQPSLRDHIVMIKNLATSQTFEVAAMQGPDGNFIYRRMPPEMLPYMMNFSAKDIQNNFLEVMESVTNMYAVTGGDVAAATSLVESSSSDESVVFPDNVEESKAGQPPTAKEFEENLK